MGNHEGDTGEREGGVVCARQTKLRVTTLRVLGTGRGRGEFLPPGRGRLQLSTGPTLKGELVAQEGG